MKSNWSKFEIMVTVLSVIAIPLTARVALVALAFAGISTAIPSVIISLFFVPLICTALLVNFLKSRDKRVWPATAVLSVFLLLFGTAHRFNVEFTKLIDLVTGYYNLETIGFYTFFALLICGGSLVGIVVGVLLAALNRKNLGN